MAAMERESASMLDAALNAFFTDENGVTSTWAVKPRSAMSRAITAVLDHLDKNGRRYLLQAWFGGYSDPIEAMARIPIEPYVGMQLEVYCKSQSEHPKQSGETHFLEITDISVELHGGSIKLAISTDGLERDEMIRAMRAVEHDEVAEEHEEWKSRRSQIETADGGDGGFATRN